VYCPWRCVGVVVNDTSFSPIQTASTGWDASLQSLSYAPCDYHKANCGPQSGQCQLWFIVSYHNCATSTEPTSPKNCP